MRVITDLPPIDVLEPGLVVTHAVQNDKLTRWFRATLYEGPSLFVPEAGATATIKFMKADGHQGWYDQLEDGTVAVSMNGSVITFGMTAQALSCAGSTKVNVGWYHPNGEIISSFAITIIVDPDPSGSFVSTDYFNVLSLEMASVLNAARNLTGLTADAHALSAGSEPTVEVTGGGEENYNLSFGIPTGPVESLTVDVHGLPTGYAPTVDLSGGGEEGYHMDLGIPVGSVGPAGIMVQSTEPENNALAWIDTSAGLDDVIVPEINDSIISDVDTWSSSKILNAIYPVGSIYMSTSSTNPFSALGFGTWEQISGRFLLAAGGGYAGGSTGGSASTTLNAGNMPSHNHTVYGFRGTTGAGCRNWLTMQGDGNLVLYTSSNQVKWTASSKNTATPYDKNAWVAGENGTTSSSGSGQAFSNMPPYLAVYMWKRTR